MSGKSRTQGRPSRGWRIPAWICAVLLTGTLTLTVFAGVGLRAVTDRELYLRAAQNEGAVALQAEEIRKDTETLAKEMGFDPERVLALITPERIRELNRTAANWWMDSLNAGEMTEEPRFFFEGAADALMEDPAFTEGKDSLQAKKDADLAEFRLNAVVRRNVVKFRNLLMKAGYQFAGRRIYLPKAVAALGRAPLILGLMSVLLAGLIALMMSRRILASGLWIGGAMSAAGLVTAGGYALIRALNLRGMLSEASPVLGLQFAGMAGTLTAWILGAAAVLLILGVPLMMLGRKES